MDREASEHDATGPSRRLVEAPPLAMEMPTDNERIARLSASAFLLAMGLVAVVTGASLLVALPLLAAAAGVFFLPPLGGGIVHLRLPQPRAAGPSASDAALAEMVDALGHIVVVRDGEGRILRANTVFADLVESTPEALRGRRLAEFGIDLNHVSDDDASAAGARDVMVPTREGERWFWWLEKARTARDGSTAYFAVARDITARRTAEAGERVMRRRAEEASAAKSRFLATVSHEIRTPLNGIMGMTKLLAQTRLTPEQSTYAGAVSTSAASLLALVDDLLDYSRIESGRLPVDPQPTDLRTLAENIVELLAARAYGRGLGLGLHVAADVPARVRLDGGKLRQILLNLIGNALKFTETGGVLVTLAMTDGTDGRVLRCAVRDTGPGMEREDLRRIFAEFEQAGPQGEARRQGAGLGLAISQRLARVLGARLQVSSRPGKGSLFSLEMPVEVMEPAMRHAALDGMAILVLSRNAMEAAALAAMIRDHGGRAVLARTVEEAARNVPRTAYDAMVVDAALEAAPGAVLARLRAEGCGAGPAVTLIAPSDRGRLAEFRRRGYAHFLPRPVRRDTLLRILLSRAGELDAPLAPAELEPIDEPAPRSGGLNVLVAEDNEINALLARTALQKAGHRVETVSNGKAAVERVTRATLDRLDVVLMDVEMPVMDGLEAIALIREHERTHRRPAVPILILTADTRTQARERVLALGATGYVAKPVDPDELVRHVATEAARM